MNRRSFIKLLPTLPLAVKAMACVTPAAIPLHELTNRQRNLISSGYRFGWTGYRVATHKPTGQILIKVNMDERIKEWLHRPREVAL